MALAAFEGRPSAITASVLQRALGGEVYAGLALVAEKGSARQRRTVRSWDGGRSADAFAAATALQRAGEADAGKVMARTGRQRVVTERNRGKGLE